MRLLLLTGVLGAVISERCAFVVGDCEQCGEEWDSDNDGISTAVEIDLNNIPIHHFDTLIPDVNHSRAYGTRSFGTLNFGINLPDTVFGAIHDTSGDFKDEDDWGTLDLINVIEQVGRWFRRRPCQTWYSNPDTLPREQVLDLSMQGGGVFPQHDEHQNGLDVDVRYMRNDDEGPLDLANPSEQQFYFDVTATLELISCFLQTGQVIRIYYDSARTNIGNVTGETILVHDPSGEHSNHMHVSIRDPDGPNN